jgi:hypothetical protein
VNRLAHLNLYWRKPVQQHSQIINKVAEACVHDQETEGFFTPVVRKKNKKPPH